ncbi:hypothetical protein [Escherichia coli]
MLVKKEMIARLQSHR